MNSSRNNILKRLNNTPPPKLNSRTSTPLSAKKDDPLKAFETHLKENAANVAYCSTSEIGDCINDILESNQLGNTLISNINVACKDSKLNIIRGKATGKETIGLSEALCGISDTGTLVLTASSKNPTTINYLVDHHFVIINENAIVETLYDAVATLKEKQLLQSRAINFISGPSRTADIEQTIQLGAHGPRHLWVLITKN